MRTMGCWIETRKIIVKRRTKSVRYRRMEDRRRGKKWSDLMSLYHHRRRRVLRWRSFRISMFTKESTYAARRHIRLVTFPTCSPSLYTFTLFLFRTQTRTFIWRLLQKASLYYIVIQIHLSCSLLYWTLLHCSYGGIPFDSESGRR